MLFEVLLLSFAALCLLFLSKAVFAWHAKSMFVIDMPDEHELPRHFREITHFKTMKIAGGGQFSQSGFAAILKKLHAERLTVLDLRQESHGFLNGNAVSWYGVHNADNQFKTPAQIEIDQARLLAKIADKKVVKINRITQKSAEGRIKRLKPVQLPVHDVISEAVFLKQLGHDYFRIYVQDYHAPAPEEVDRFIQIYKILPKHQWIYFHCRAGIGRTTVFMMMYDMLLHAKEVSFHDIVDRQVVIGGKDIRKLLPKSHYKYEWHAERLQFIKDFYQYARDNNDGFQTLFSEWL